VIGWYGHGLDCRPCPEGGYCPGGYRVWPLPGYWNENEFTPILLKCQVAEACLGGRFSECAAVYTGRACGTCIDGYYHSNDATCQPCESQGMQAVLILCQVYRKDDCICWFAAICYCCSY